MVLIATPQPDSGDSEWKKYQDYIRNQERPWWFQTAKEVRESDESKVKDYKEDIDTLLVFVRHCSILYVAITSSDSILLRVLYSPPSLQRS